MIAVKKPNRTQRERLQQSQATWVPPGRSVEINGRTIPGGMLYVGSKVAGLHANHPVEPALIDPKLKIRPSATFRGWQNSYWNLLAYHKLAPLDRATYLDWLASGRQESPTYQQALLFFYGIERRIMFDARYDEQAVQEIPALLDEVDRMLSVYRDYSISHLRNAASNLRLAGLLRLPDYDPTAIEPPMKSDGWHLPLAVEVALGIFAQEQRPLPPKWACSWALCSPYTFLKTVEQRCPQEFADYFAMEYHREFGEGIVVPSLSYGGPLTYTPLNPSFQRSLQIGVQGIPSIGSVVSSTSPLAELVRRISLELEPFARSLPSGPGRTSPLWAYGLLPPGMDPLADRPRVAPFVDLLETALGAHSTAIIEKQSLLACFPDIEGGPGLNQALGLSRLLDRLGYGIEPDPAAMKTPFLRAEHIGLYRYELGENYSNSDHDLSPEMALLSLWSYVAASDGPIQDRTSTGVCEIIIPTLDLQPFAINRLYAHAGWLARHPASLADARRRFGSAEGWDIELIASIFLAMVHVDAIMTPQRIKALSKIYVTFGLSDERLHSDLHRMSTSLQPLTPTRDNATERIVALDSSQVARVREQTDSVASLLHDVFDEDDRRPDRNNAPETPTSRDDPYSVILARLSDHRSWPMTELTQLAASVGLMASGAIETINERAIALGFDPPADLDSRGNCEIDLDALAAVMKAIGI